MRTLFWILVLFISACQYQPLQTPILTSQGYDSVGPAQDVTGTTEAVDAAGDATPVDVPGAETSDVTIKQDALLCADCNDGDKCTEDVCKEGVCWYGPAKGVCDDGNPCTEDSCTNNSCKTSEKDCNDADPCTEDSCAKGSCLHYKQDCEDGDPCTEDTCSKGACLHPFKVCKDDNPCTDDACSIQGNAAAIPNTDPCQDGSMCTKQDTCFGGKCLGLPVDCDDKDKCTVDSCNPDQGCMHLVSNAACLDDDPCTVDETCLNNTCTNKPKNCDDGNDCTVESCLAGKGCSNLAYVGPLKYCSSPDPTAYFACSAGTCMKFGETFCPPMNQELNVTTKQPVFWKDARAVLVREYNACYTAGACPSLVTATNPNPHHVHKIVELSKADSTNKDIEIQCQWNNGAYNTLGYSVCTNPEEPVLVPSNVQADAYCKWRGGRVPTWDEMKLVMGTMVSNGDTFPSAQCTVIGNVTDVPSKLWTYLAKCGNSYMSAPSKQVTNVSKTPQAKMEMVSNPTTWEFKGNTELADIGFHVKNGTWETHAQIYCVFDQKPAKECWP